MVDLRISELPAASTSATTDIFPTTQGSTGPATGVTRKITAGQILDLLVSPPPIGTTTPAAGTFSTLIGTGTTTLGNGLANYLTVVGAATATPPDVTFPLVTAVGADTNIDIRVVPKGTGYLSAPKLFTGSDAVRETISTATQVYLRSSAVVTGTNSPIWFAGGIYSGTPTGGDIALHAFSSTETILGGVTGTTVLHQVEAGGTGGRTAFSARLQVNGKPSTTTAAFLVGAGLTARASSSYNGTAGNHIGALFASNNIASLRVGAGAEWGTVVSAEFDTTMPLGTGADFHIGVSSILHWDNGVNHDVRGAVQDTAFMIGSARNDRATVGWRIGYSYGDPVGWPFNDDSQLIGIQPVTTAFEPYARARTMGDGLALVGVTLKRAALITEDAAIDLDGHIGGQTTSGVRLQARDSVLAKSAVVASLTALQPDGGGLYFLSNVPTVVIDAPPAGFSGSATATATILTHGAAYGIQSITNAGTGYTVGDVLTMVGGTFTVAAQVTVVEVASGVIRSAIVSRAGSYTVLPPSPTTFTGGTGSNFTGATNWTALTFNVTSGGVGYPEFPAPNARFDFGVGAAGRQPIIKVVMTGTQIPLKLNPAGQVLFPNQGAVAAAGTTQGTATAITSDYVDATAAALQLGVRLPPALVGMRKVVSSAAASLANVLALYPATGEEIFISGTGGLGANLPQSVLAEEAFALECTVAGRWYGYRIS